MRIDAPIITGSFSLNGSTLQNLSAVSTTGSNTFVGNQNVQGYISASALTGSIDFANLTNSPTLVSGSSQVIDILSSLNTTTASFTPRISNLESKSASVDISITNINSVTASNIARLSNLETKSSSVDISITNINSYTSSQDTKNTTLGSYTGSNDTKWTSIGNLTGSYATTGSNTFYGTQVFSGSVFIATDLIVQGSSSIQYISASSVSIGTNIVNLNTATPSVRYAGMSVQDSGSSAGVTGSMLWDSLCNRWIYSNPSTIGYSGGMLLSGPRASTLGTETTLTCNYIAKSGGGDHLYDSCIIDDGTTVCINANLKGSGTITGTTIYGSTAVCSPVGKFTTCLDLGGALTGTSATFSSNVCVPTLVTTNCINIGTTVSLGSRLSIESVNDQAGITMYNSYDCNKWSLRTGTVGVSNKGFAIVDDICNITRIQINGAGYVGIGTCSPSAILDSQTNSGAGNILNSITDVVARFGNINTNPGNHYGSGLQVYQGTGTIGSGYAAGFLNVSNNSATAQNSNTLALIAPSGMNGGLRFYANDSSADIRYYTANTERIRITSTGIACFACQFCAPMASISGCIGIGTNPGTYTLKAGGRGYFFATNQDAGWGMLTLDYGNGTNSSIYAIQMYEGGVANAAIGYGSYASPSNCGDLIMWTNDGGGLVERSRMYSNGAAKIAHMNSNSTTILQKSFSVGAGACVNVCFDIFNDIPGKGSGYVFQADIHVGGYGSAGASGLLYKASVAGYDGHHVGLGSYHKDAELVKCASGVDIKIYNPAGCSCLLGVTIYNCSGTYVHVGTLRMVLTY